MRQTVTLKRTDAAKLESERVVHVEFLYKDEALQGIVIKFHEGEVTMKMDSYNLVLVKDKPPEVYNLLLVHPHLGVREHSFKTEAERNELFGSLSEELKNYVTLSDAEGKYPREKTPEVSEHFPL